MMCPPNISISPSVNQRMNVLPSLGIDTFTSSIRTVNSSAEIGGSSLHVSWYSFSIALETMPYASTSDARSHATIRCAAANTSENPGCRLACRSRA